MRHDWAVTLDRGEQGWKCLACGGYVKEGPEPLPGEGCLGKVLTGLERRCLLFLKGEEWNQVTPDHWRCDTCGGYRPSEYGVGSSFPCGHSPLCLRAALIAELEARE